MKTAPPGKLERVLARRLREVAEQRGIPLSHVADRADIARSHLWAILGMERSATLGLVQRLAEVLEVDPLQLLQGRPARPTKRRRKR